jgi:hypothetical protein
MGGLSYKKDPSRPGGGVFVLHGDAKDGNIKDLMPGVVITTSEEESEGTGASPTLAVQSPNASERAISASGSSSSPFAPPLPGDETTSGKARPRQLVIPRGAASTPTPTPTTGSSLPMMVNLTPLRGGAPGGPSNVNPAMNAGKTPGHVTVMNVLDVSQASNNTLEQLSNADIGFLEGIPGAMFDWGEL